MAYYSYRELGIEGAEIVRVLGVSRPAITKAVMRGKDFVRQSGIMLISKQRPCPINAFFDSIGLLRLGSGLDIN